MSETPAQAQPTAKWPEIAIETNRQLAETLNLKSAKMLTWLTRSKGSHYSVHKIRTGRSSKVRTIYDPDKSMRFAQSKVLEHILDKISLPGYLWAFEAGKSVPDMAELHTNKAVVLSVDIKNYFPSIHQNQIEQLLHQYNIQGAAARTLSELLTYRFFVPQGALTSPKLSNMVSANTFAEELNTFFTEKGLTFTVYADDITISSANRLEMDTITEYLQKIDNTLRQHGFRVNSRKTKIMFRNRRQWVCGAVVNEKRNLVRKEREKLRAIVHNVVKNGLDHEADKNSIPADRFLAQLKGKLNWYMQLNFDRARVLVDKLNNYLSQHQEVVGS